VQVVQAEALGAGGLRRPWPWRHSLCRPAAGGR